MYGTKAKDLLVEVRRSEGIPAYNVGSPAGLVRPVCALSRVGGRLNGAFTPSLASSPRTVQKEGVRGAIAETEALMEEAHRISQ